MSRDAERDREYKRKWAREHRKNPEVRKREAEACRRYRANLSEKQREERKAYQTRYRLAHRRYFADYERKKRKDNPAQRIIKAARRRAKIHNLDFNISEKDISLPKKCPALGIPIDYLRDTLGDDSPSLDRIDNNKGYVKKNVIVVSFRANRIKSNATIKELKKLADFYGDIRNVP